MSGSDHSGGNVTFPNMSALSGAPANTSTSGSLSITATTLPNTDVDPLIVALEATEPLEITLQQPAPGTYRLNLNAVTLTFVDPHIENMYLVSRCLTIRATTLACVLMALALVVSYLIAIQQTSEKAGTILFLKNLFLGTIFLFLAGVNIVLCEREPSPPDSLPEGGQSLEEKESGEEEEERGDLADDNDGSDGHPNTMPSSASASKFRAAVKVAQYAERIAICVMVPIGFFYVFDPIQTAGCVDGSLGGSQTTYSCVHAFYNYGPLVVLLSLLIVNIRMHITVFIIVLDNVLAGVVRLALDDAFYAEFQPLSPVVPWMSWQVIAMWSGCAVVAVLAKERFHRRSFITRLRLLEKENKVEVHRRHFNQTLRTLLPGGAVAKLAAGQPVEDYAQQCCISVCEVKDFNRWCTTLLPTLAMETVDALFSAFDQSLEAIRSYSTVRKTIMTGDCYIVAAGLRESEEEAATSSSSTQTLALDCCRFAKNQIYESSNVVAEVQLKISVGIALGECFGSILGQHYLRYNLSGPAFQEAKQLARLAGNNEVYTNLATLRATGSTDLKGREVPTGGRNWRPSGAMVLGGIGGGGAADARDEGERSEIHHSPERETTPTKVAPLAAAEVEQVVKEAAGDPVDSSACWCPAVEDVSTVQPVKIEAFPRGRSWHQRPRVVWVPREPEEGTQQVEIDAFRALLATSSSGLLFESPDTEAAFWAAMPQQRSVREECHIDLLTSFMVALVIYMVPIFEENASGPHLLLTTIGLGIAGLRYVLRIKLASDYQWIPYWLLFLQNTLMLFSTIFIQHPRGILTQAQLPLAFVMSFVVFLANGCVRWSLSVPMTILQSMVVVATMALALDGLRTIRPSFILAYFFTIPIFNLAVYKGERERRAFFGTMTLNLGATAFLEAKMTSHRNLLHKVMPPYVVENVIVKIRDGGNCVVQQLSDCVVLAVRLRTALPTSGNPKNGKGDKSNGSEERPVLTGGGGSSGEDLSGKLVNYYSSASNERGQEGISTKNRRLGQLLRDQFQSVEQVLHQLKASEAHCSLIHVVGDTVLVGGPLVNPKAEKEKLAASAVEMAQFRGLDQRQIFEQAAGQCAGLLVRSVGLLRQHFGTKLTASLASGTGYAAALGQYLPSFDLLGPASRSAVEVLDAVPDGFLCCTESFLKLLEVTEQAKVVTETGFDALSSSRIGSSSASLRLRGAGQVRVFPLRRTREEILKQQIASERGWAPLTASTTTSQPDSSPEEFTDTTTVTLGVSGTATGTGGKSLNSSSDTGGSGQE